jgi:hypothetical protein
MVALSWYNCAAICVALTLPLEVYSVSETTDLSVSSLNDNEIMIEDFSHAVNKWDTMNDPVMGGQSVSSLEIKDGVAHFEGTCAIVPFLKAPGFITMVAGGFYQGYALFPDVSNCSGLKLVLRTSVSYKGYYVSFGKVQVPGGGHATGFKTPLEEVPMNDFGEMILPFSSFSSKWDEATGKTQVECSAEDSQYCPTEETLQNMKTMSFWGEGVEGEVSLDIKSISAVGCDSGLTSELKDSLNTSLESQASSKKYLRSGRVSND